MVFFVNMYEAFPSETAIRTTEISNALHFKGQANASKI